jgi:hypothetical protein
MYVQQMLYKEYTLNKVTSFIKLMDKFFNFLS